MIRLGGSAYSAREHFDDSDLFSKPGAVWCYRRFGTTLTELPDGRFVQIGGEHEDHYDPDFHIYNDVVIHNGCGEFAIYGYPKAVFPPTDFHTATLVRNSIYIIGCLGYEVQRDIARTPVYRLQLESWNIEVVVTSGEMPGPLHEHCSRYDVATNVVRVAGGQHLTVGEDNNSQITPNGDQFELNLSTFHWRKTK